MSGWRRWRVVVMVALFWAATAAVLAWRTTAFGQPESLVWLAVASGVLLLLAGEARQALAGRARYADPALLQRIGDPSPVPALLARGLLLFGALVLLLMALARPKGGLGAETVASEGIDLMICLDVSNSMRARDMGSQSRLAAAKAFLARFVQQRAGDRIGLIGFAGSAHVMCPFTVDLATLGTFLDDLDYTSVAQQGTRVGDALRLAVGRFDPTSPRGRAVVLLTDGEDLGSDPLEAAREARRRGVIVHTIGLGTAAGATIPMSSDVFGHSTTKRYRGREVVSRLDEQTLRAVAEITHGAYFHAGTIKRLGEVSDALAGLRTATAEGRRVELREDIATWYLLPALLALAVEPLLRRRRPRRRR